MEFIRSLVETVPDFWISGQVDQWLLGGKGMWTLVGPFQQPFQSHTEAVTYCVNE